MNTVSQAHDFECASHMFDTWIVIFSAQHWSESEYKLSMCKSLFFFSEHKSVIYVFTNLWFVGSTN